MNCLPKLTSQKATCKFTSKKCHLSASFSWNSAHSEQKESIKGENSSCAVFAPSSRPLSHQLFVSWHSRVSSHRLPMQHQPHSPRGCSLADDAAVARALRCRPDVRLFDCQAHRSRLTSGWRPTSPGLALTFGAGV